MNIDKLYLKTLEKTDRLEQKIYSQKGPPFSNSAYISFA
jgi:hypothetical protein